MPGVDMRVQRQAGPFVDFVIEWDRAEEGEHAVEQAGKGAPAWCRDIDRTRPVVQADDFVAVGEHAEGQK